jgi:hypothetical protein
MRNFKIGDIVKVKMLQNRFSSKHSIQKTTIPIGTVGRVTTHNSKYFPNYLQFRVVFYIKKGDIKKHKWKNFIETNFSQLYPLDFEEINKIGHHFSKKQLIDANEKEAKKFKELEEIYIARELAERL